MSTLEEKFRAATESREIPGVVLFASSTDGKFQYKEAFGPATPSSPITPDSTFILASCTKLLTSIAALQTVEKGLIGLDDDVSTVLTELKDIQLITGFKEDGTDEPIFKKPENKITLRQAYASRIESLHTDSSRLLLSHSSGFTYDGASPILTRWRKWLNQPATQGHLGSRGRNIIDEISIPLIFEPGTSFEYGVSLDVCIPPLSP